MNIDKRKTYFLDFDGTIVYHKCHKQEEDIVLPGTIDFFTNTVRESDFVIITTARDESHKNRIKKFMKSSGFKCDLVICGISSGERILINDKKPDGTKTAFSLNLQRDKGLSTIKDFK